MKQGKWLSYKNEFLIISSILVFKSKHVKDGLLSISTHTGAFFDSLFHFFFIYVYILPLTLPNVIFLTLPICCNLSLSFVLFKALYLFRFFLSLSLCFYLPLPIFILYCFFLTFHNPSRFKKFFLL